MNADSSVDIYFGPKSPDTPRRAVPVGVLLAAFALLDRRVNAERTPVGAPAELARTSGMISAKSSTRLQL